VSTKDKKAGGEVPAFENCDTFYGVFFWWLLDQPPAERTSILRDGLPIRRLVEDIAPRKVVMTKLRGRGGKAPSPGAYPYAVTASLRARDYFLMLDSSSKESVATSGSDTFVYRRPEVIDTVLVPNPNSLDARARGFPYTILCAETGLSAPEAEVAPPARARRAPPKRKGAREKEPGLEEAASPGEPEWSVPPAFQSAAPGWQRRRASPARPAPPPRSAEEPVGGGGPGWEWTREPGGREAAPQTEVRERRATAQREPARPVRRAAPSLVLPVPPLAKRSAEDILADYLSSAVGPPLVHVERKDDGRVRYKGWAADLGLEVAPGKRSLDFRQDRDFTTFLFLVAALSLDGGYATTVKHLSALFETNLVSSSFWRDEGTLLKVGAPRRLPIPQPLQIAFHVIARNEPLIRDVLGFEEIMAGRRPTLDVERIYRTLMAERMEMPRYWTGPFKRNRRHRRLLPSRLGRVLVARIPTLLRELHCQGVVEVDPAECCTADRIVRRAMYAAGIPVKKPINRMAPLRENSRAIYERFGDLFEMPLYLYGRSWRRR